MPSLLLDRCRVVDPVAEATREGQAILIDGGTIVAVDRAGALRPTGADVVVDLAGAAVLPGLWDVHCHPGMHPDAVSQPFETASVRAERVAASLRDALRAGVTGVRVTGEAHGADLALRSPGPDAPALPRVVAYGPAIKTVGGHGHRADWPPSDTPGVLADPFGSVEVTGVDDLVRQVEDHVRRGVDGIKLFVTGGIAGSDETPDDLQLSADQLAAACRTAHAHGIPVAAHLGNPEATRIAVQAGIDSVEHGYRLDEPTVALMAEHDTWLVPTLGISHAHERMEAMGWPQQMIDRAARIAPTHRRSLELAVAAGVRIASGSDMRPLATASVDEVVLLGQVGLGSATALRAATSEAAALCGSAAGRIVVGAPADLLVVDDDPLVDLTTLRRPRAVLRAGSLLEVG